MASVSRLEDLAYEWLSVARSLLPTVAAKERKHVYSWLAKLRCGDQSVVDLRTRLDYLYYLMRGLSEGFVLPPFTGPAPLTSLAALTDLLPRPVYVEVLAGVDKAITTRQVDELRQPPVEEEQAWDLSPEHFYNVMPRPREGAFCYCCVFAPDDD